MRGIKIVVLEVDQIHLVDGLRVDFSSVQQLDSIGTRQSRINPAIIEMPADLLTMERDGLLLGRVPHHEAA